jgi:hypothetical protein
MLIQECFPETPKDFGKMLVKKMAAHDFFMKRPSFLFFTARL